MSAIIGTAFYWTRLVFRLFTQIENYLQQKGEKMMSTHKKVSLSEVNQSIETPKNNNFWQNLKAFLGPGALVAVGYMDPGNWITSVVGGASYKYTLLFVILISSLIAMQLQ